MRKTSIAAATFLSILPVLAFGWTPYAPGMGVPPAYQGYPGTYGAPYGGPARPMAPGYPGGWPAMPDGRALFDRPDRMSQPPVAGTDRGPYARPTRSMSTMPRLDISKRMEDGAYLIDIAVANIAPDEIAIRPIRRGLIVSYNKAVQSRQDGRLPDRGGYMSSYSFSRGMTSRRLGLPPDAKLDAMSREVSDGHILLRIPRDRNALRRGW